MVLAIALMADLTSMKFLLSVHRRVEWLYILPYIIIIIAEILILWKMRDSPQANLLRYIVLFTVVSISVLLVRIGIINPIQQMKEASLFIADGNYHNRLPAYSSIELDELAQTFNRMASKLEKVETQRVDLIGNVAHELRTPLNNIRITMEGLIDEVFLANTETFLDIQHEVSRLQRLVYQLEKLSQAEGGQIAIHKRVLDYDQLVQTVCGRLNVQYESKGVTLSYDSPPYLPLMRLDCDHITQVLVNLLGNALQYTPSGGMVSVKIQVDGNQVFTCIQDTGIGIDATEMTHIFERFYRVDKSRARNSGGNGIGLTIARHLILAHRGVIHVESSGLGHGSKFTFTLPL